MRKKLNTQSSNEAELVRSDYFMYKIVWTGHFLKMQGLCQGRRISFQENKSTSLPKKKGSISAEKCMRRLDIIYLFIKDILDRGGIKIKHCPKRYDSGLVEEDAAR